MGLPGDVEGCSLLLNLLICAEAEGGGSERGDVVFDGDMVLYIYVLFLFA